MGARSATQYVGHPWPAVFEAIVSAAPANGFTIVAADPATGRVELETRRERITVSTGAVDAITTEWVADFELKLGIGRDRHAEHIARLAAAIDAHLATYYG